jgi:hypothetical protein
MFQKNHHQLTRNPRISSLVKPIPTVVVAICMVAMFKRLANADNSSFLTQGKELITRPLKMRF